MPSLFTEPSPESSFLCLTLLYVYGGQAPLILRFVCSRARWRRCRGKTDAARKKSAVNHYKAFFGSYVKRSVNPYPTLGPKEYE